MVAATELTFFNADLTQTLTTLVYWLIHAVVYGTVLALVTWALLSSALRRMRPAIHAVFWLVVLLKFVLPVGPGWDYSLASVVHRFAPLAPESQARPEADPTFAYVTLVPVDSAASSNVAPPPAVGAMKPPAQTPVSWTMLVGLAYLSGLLIVGCVRLNSYRRFAAATRRFPLAGDDATELVVHACRRLGIHRTPRVRMSDAAPAPYVINAWKPTLVLAHRHLADRDELETVILHELAHLRRGDLLVRYVQWLAGTILYFWPVVAWVNRRIDLAREHACDEWALRHGRLSPTQYARCLLRAAQPVRSRLVAYAPAAMAANAKHVERRIEMIINAGSHPRRNRMIGLLAGAALCGWAGFVLTGATGAAVAPKVVKSGGDGPCAGASGMMFLKINADGNEEDADFLMPMTFDLPIPFGGEAGNMMFIAADDEDGADAPMHAITMKFTLAGAGGIAAFGQDHPAADADGDGTVSKAEHDAYLIALAMRAPAGVLAQYPEADRNHDGKLDASEAARLVVAPPGMPKVMAFHGAAGATTDIPAGVLAKLPADVVARIHGGAGAGTIATADAKGDGSSPQQLRIMRKVTNVNGNITEETQEGDNPPVIRVFRAGEDGEATFTVPTPDGGTPETRVLRVNRGDDGDTHEFHVIARTAGEGDGAALPRRIALTGMNHSLPEPAAIWLIQNVDATPTTAEVNRYLALAESAPLEQFLEMNPKADRNHDGKLTVEERDQYIEVHQTQMRSRILKQHPEADANGDGVLSDEEMHNFFRSRVPAGGANEDVQVIGGGEGARRMIIRRSDGSADQHEIHVEVITEDGASLPK